MTDNNRPNGTAEAEESVPSKHSVNNFSELRDATGSASWELLTCPECYGELATSWSRHNAGFSWAISLHCDRCETPPWVICRECSSVRTRFLVSRQASRHNYECHSSRSTKNKRLKLSDSKVLNTMETSSDVFNESEANVGLPEGVDEHINSIAEMVGNSRDQFWANIQACMQCPLQFQYSRKESTEYFKRQHHGLGAAYLVGYSQFRQDNVARELDPEEVDLHVHLAYLASGMSRGQRTILAKVLQKVVACTRKQTLELTNGNQKAWTTEVPGSKEEIRKRLMEGEYAFIPNLPHPKVRVIGDHASLSLIDCIADLLGHGTEIDVINENTESSDVTHIGQTRHALAIKETARNLHMGQAVIPLWINEWSDDFEPNDSIKANRGSVWLKCVTLGTPHGKGTSTTRNTYPIAVGPKGASHESVEEMFKNELLSISDGSDRWFYHGGVKGMVRVHAEIFVSLQDQPERRSANFIMLGNGTFTARWGHALDFASVASGVPACSQCLTNLLHQTECPGTPETECRNYTIMKEAVSLTHKEVVSGNWSLDNGRSYLRVHGLNTESVSAVIECANNARTFNILDATKDENPSEYEAILRERNLEPDQFKAWKFPALWERGVGLHQHIEACMHLLFLGVQKTTVRRIQKWARSRSKFETFLKYTSGILESVMRLNLSWCRALPYSGGKLGGWVSENYLAMARLCKWFYSKLDSIASDPVFVEPTIPQSRWLKKHNLGWLSARGLDSKGCADDLRDRVQSFMSDPTVPDILPPSGGSVDNVMSVVTSFSAMVSRLMVPTVNPSRVKDAERHIKIFLNSFDKMDQELRDATQGPTWISSYNFVCLLNLPGVMTEFGPLRNLWEGGHQGEGMLRHVKPELISGLRQNWQKNLLEKLLKRKSMEQIIEKQNHHQEQNSNVVNKTFDEETANQLPKMHEQYRGFGHLVRVFHNGDAISVILRHSGEFGCTLVGGRFVKLICGDYTGTINGMAYHTWEIEAASDNATVTDHSPSSISRYCLLLPRLQDTGLPKLTGNSEFTLIDSEWLEIQPDKEMMLPRIDGPQ